MQKILVAVALAATLVACGKKEEMQGIPPVSQEQTQQGPSQAPQAPQVQQHSEGSSWLPAILGGAAGYMMGRASAPTPQPQVVERNVYRDRPVYTRPAQPSAPAIGSAVPKPSPAPVPKFTAPVAPAPQVAQTPKPSYSQSTSSYKTPSYSFKPSPSYSSPSRSYSSPSRR